MASAKACSSSIERFVIGSAIVNATQGFKKERTTAKIVENDTLLREFLTFASSMILNLIEKGKT